MTAFAVDVEVNLVARRHVCATAETRMPHWHLGQDVRTYDNLGLAAESVERALFYHQAGAARPTLFARLEDDHEPPLQFVAHLPKYFAYSQERSRVEVMATGVHHALVQAAHLVALVFGDWQRVHVGAQSHRPSRLAALNESDNAMTRLAAESAKARLERYANLSQLVCHIGRRGGLVKRQLRVAVQMAARGHGLVKQAFGRF